MMASTLALTTNCKNRKIAPFEPLITVISQVVDKQYLTRFIICPKFALTAMFN